MESLDVPLIESPVKEYKQKLEERAEKHESLRGRNNQTFCRSPTQGIDAKWMKTEMQRKRQLEFERRRSASPDLTCPEQRRKSKGQTVINNCKGTMSLVRRGKICRTFSSNKQPLVLTPSKSLTNEDDSTNEWVLLWLHQESEKKDESILSTSTPMREIPKQTVKTSKKIDQLTLDTSLLVHKTGSNNVTFTGVKTGMGEYNQPKRILREASVQTESGLITVKETEVLQLANYLQEALWREEAQRKKMAVLQKNASTLIHSSDKLWTIRCNEDLLRSQIKALEAQLQVCLQKYSRDGVKKLLVQMEKQKGVYEAKALAAIQRATQDKVEALSKTETLQEVLRVSKAEALQWQCLYEELKQSSGQLKKSQEVSRGQLQQLQSQLEMARCKEAGLLEEVESLQLAGVELCSSLAQLEEDNQALREDVRSTRDGSTETEDYTAQVSVSSEQAEEEDLGWERAQLTEQLCQTRDRLQLKEKECEELQTELEAMGQECLSYQTRLTQCRDELRQLSNRRSRRLCGYRLGVCVFLVLLLAVAGAAMLWLWHPPFREQVKDLYANIEKRVEDYLLEVASPQHSGCFRPV